MKSYYLKGPNNVLVNLLIVITPKLNASIELGEYEVGLHFED